MLLHWLKVSVCFVLKSLPLTALGGAAVAVALHAFAWSECFLREGGLWSGSSEAKTIATTISAA